MHHLFLIPNVWTPNWLVLVGAINFTQNDARALVILLTSAIGQFLKYFVWSYCRVRKYHDFLFVLVAHFNDLEKSGFYLGFELGSAYLTYTLVMDFSIIYLLLVWYYIRRLLVFDVCGGLIMKKYYWVQLQRTKIECNKRENKKHDKIMSWTGFVKTDGQCALNWVYLFTL